MNSVLAHKKIHGIPSSLQTCLNFAWVTGYAHLGVLVTFKEVSS
ncbi:hypothetical protein Hanom_Chr00s095972g01801241 [Helianthus anomalus]